MTPDQVKNELDISEVAIYCKLAVEYQAKTSRGEVFLPITQDERIVENKETDVEGFMRQYGNNFVKEVM